MVSFAVDEFLKNDNQLSSCSWERVDQFKYDPCYFYDKVWSLANFIAACAALFRRVGLSQSLVLNVF